MTSKSKTDIKAFFETGDKPTEPQFIDLIDSYVDKLGPLGALEAAASAGGTGVAAFAAGVPSIASYAILRASQGIEIYTSAQSDDIARAALFDILPTTTSGAIEKTGSNTFGVFTVSDFAKTLLDDADQATARATLDVPSNAQVNSWEIVSEQDPSAAADWSVDALFVAGYDYQIVGRLLPATDAVTLRLTASIVGSGAFLTGASDYAFAVEGVLTGSGAIVETSNGAANVNFTTASTNVGNAAGRGISFTINLEDPNNAAGQRRGDISHRWFNSSGNFASAAGSFQILNAAAIDGLRLAFSSGNMTGRVVVYRRKNT
jgi:hypothetical protein